MTPEGVEAGHAWPAARLSLAHSCVENRAIVLQVFRPCTGAASTWSTLSTLSISSTVHASSCSSLTPSLVTALLGWSPLGVV